MKFKSLLPVLFLLFSFNRINAQMPMMGGGKDNKIYDGKITGSVVDSGSQKIVELANVALYKSGSEKPLDGTVTDEKGNFKLKNIKPGTYKVTVSFIGYLNQDFDSIEISDKKYNIELGKILFKPNTKLLNEAVIEGQKPLVESQIDKLVYNADKDITSKGGNATDVLRKVPMVTVDLDGNVSLQGTQNIKVLINNKPSSVMASSVAEAMKMIPADEIEKVEVITSPSAKYDAEGTGGIINIITKKKNIEGISGAIYAGAGTRSSNLYISTNYHKERFGTGLSVGGFGYRGKGKLSTVRTTEFSTLTQDGDNSNYGYGPFIQWTTDYDLSSKNNFSTSLRLNNFNNKSSGITGNAFSVGDINYYNYSSDFSTKTGGWSYDANANYKRTFKKPDREFTLAAQLTNNDRNTDYDVTRTIDTIFNPLLENSRNKSRNREITFQADYVHPFSKKVSLETGAKTIMRDVTSDYNYYITNPFSYELVYDADRSNVFDYSQDIYSGYLQGALTLSRFGFKAGGRFEQTEVHGKFDKSNHPFNGIYSNLIPSTTVSWKKAGRYNLKLSYTQRIQRPSMNYLNPYVNSSDKFNISYGNPDLEAEKSHAFELGYNIFRGFGSINTSFYHRFTNNAIESVRFIDSSDVYITTYDNIGKNYSTGASVGGNYIWKLKIIIGGNFNIFYYKVKSADPLLGLSNDGINYNVNLFVSYKFNEKWGVQTFGNFNGPKYSVQGKSTSFFYYNLSLRRSFKGDKGGIGLGLDNFASRYIYFKNTYTGNDFTYTNTNRINFIGVRLSFDYRFGKMEFKQSKKSGIKNDDLKEGGDDNQQGGQMGGGK
ncbi:MAG TPA: TonB-dependent receptor [Bacteroidia bacterium]|nr:TonB-dependent receptor [Bacteroidia bacterium]